MNEATGPTIGMVDFDVYVPDLVLINHSERITVKVPVHWDGEIERLVMDPEAHRIIEETNARRIIDQAERLSARNAVIPTGAEYRPQWSREQLIAEAIRVLDKPHL